MDKSGIGCLAGTVRVLALAGAASGLFAQDVLQPEGGIVRLFTTDAAVLEAQEIRKDLPCTVTPTKPQLGFDLKYHTGYDVSIPLKELAGSENLLTMVFRVNPEDRPNDFTYFQLRRNVPQIDEDAKGDAILEGAFDVGEGRYHVSWLMRDRAERVCAFNWDIDATLSSRDKQIALDIAADEIRAGEREPFKQEPPIVRDHNDEPLNVKVIVNFAPQDSTSAALQPLDTSALLSILRNIAREPRIGKFSIVAFNMQEQRVIYRQQDASQIDFPALGEAIKSLNLGTVNLKQLAQKHSDSDFLNGLFAAELGPDPDHPDAVIIAGPKVSVDDAEPGDAVKQMGDPKFPVFYMNYNLNPQANPWRDAIGNTVRSLKGVEYTISRPRDLFFAWTEIIGRIVRLKLGRTAAGGSSSQ